MNIMIVCLIFSVLSIVMTSGNDDIAKAKAEAEAAAAEAEAVVAKAKAAAEAAAAAEAEEPDTSLMSFSTSAALSSDDDFIAPDISAGKVPVNCVIGGWEDFGECDPTTGKIRRRREITPAKYGGTCKVSADADGYDTTGSRDCDRYCTLDANWDPPNATCPTACGQDDITIVQRRGQSVSYVPPGQGNTCYDAESLQRKHETYCEAIACPPSSPPSTTHACRPRDPSSYLAGACEHLTTQGSCESTDDNYDIWANYPGASPNFTCHWVDIRPPSSPPSAPPSASCKARWTDGRDNGIGAGACPDYNQTECTSNDELAYGESKSWFCEWK